MRVPSKALFIGTRTILGTQKGTLIWRTTHMLSGYSLTYTYNGILHILNHKLSPLNPKLRNPKP